MANIKPFRAVRPQTVFADKTAALPYDVYNREEAKKIAAMEPLSFLNIDRPETQFPADADMYADEVYAMADNLLKRQIRDGIYIQDSKPCYYIYELTMGTHIQTGLVAGVSVDDYLNDIVKKHENTRAEKELDRIRHIDRCSAQTGPIFLTYHSDKNVDEIILNEKKNAPIYDFISDDQIKHRCWMISDEHAIKNITDLFSKINYLYIADGHHRSASAVKSALIRREKYPDYTGEEEFNTFLSVIFPDNQLQILPYYRVIKDLNNMSSEEFLNQLEIYFDITPKNNDAVTPDKPYVFGCYLDHKWYQLSLKQEYLNDDVLDTLDVSVLQNIVLKPMLGISDPKTDQRIKFVGGIRGTKELEQMCNEGMAVAFTLYPTSIKQLFDIADAHMLMPPKSTWFEPKLRSGLFIHKIER